MEAVEVEAEQDQNQGEDAEGGGVGSRGGPEGGGAQKEGRCSQATNPAAECSTPDTPGAPALRIARPRRSAS